MIDKTDDTDTTRREEYCRKVWKAVAPYMHACVYSFHPFMHSYSLGKMYTFIYLSLTFMFCKELHVDICNLGQNICRLFHILAQFLFTKSEAKLEYCHQKMIV